MNHSLLPRIGTASLPARYEAAKVALLECNKVDECKDWADKAAALASYAKQSQDTEMEKTAMRIRDRAIRRCGELLKEIEKAKPGPKQLNGDAHSQLSPRDAAAKSAKLSKNQAVTAIRVANVAKDLFESQVEGDDPPTVTALAEQGKRPQNGKPVYERLGLAKKDFETATHFQGSIAYYVQALSKCDAASVAGGSTPKEKKTIKEHIETIEKYHSRLKKEL